MFSLCFLMFSSTSSSKISMTNLVSYSISKFLILSSSFLCASILCCASRATPVNFLGAGPFLAPVSCAVELVLATTSSVYSSFFFNYYFFFWPLDNCLLSGSSCSPSWSCCCFSFSSAAFSSARGLFWGCCCSVYCFNSFF